MYSYCEGLSSVNDGKRGETIREREEVVWKNKMKEGEGGGEVSWGCGERLGRMDEQKQDG